MSQTRVSKKLRARVAANARHRCGYCLTQESIVGTARQIDHLVPEALGGKTIESNLWLACPTCNTLKADRTCAVDLASGHLVPLFNPSTQAWREHFKWNKDRDTIIGNSSTGRATVLALQLNRVILVEARRLWVRLGLHPPMVE